MIADYLIAAHWLPIPMVPGTKKPLIRWKHLTDLQPPFDRAHLGFWQQYPDAGVAILLKPSGLLVVDCDDTSAVHEVIQLCDKTGLQPNNIAITAHGAHFYFSLPEDCPPLRRIQTGDSGKIDILADGFVVAPPTMHSSGVRYEWLKRGPLQPAPEWATARLKEVRARSIASTELAPDDVMEAFPNTPEDMQQLRVAVKAVNPMLIDMLQGTVVPPDRSRALWLCINTLIRLKIRQGGGLYKKLGDESIAKVVWFGALQQKPRERGWQWLCDEIARARLELTPD